MMHEQCVLKIIVDGQNPSVALVLFFLVVMLARRERYILLLFIVLHTLELLHRSSQGRVFSPEEKRFDATFRLVPAKREATKS